MAPKPGITRGFAVAAAYAPPESFTFLCDSCSAIFATASTRAAICRRVKPSGKTTRNCRSWRIVVVGWAALLEPQPATTAASSTAADRYERAAHHSR